MKINSEKTHLDSGNKAFNCHNLKQTNKSCKLNQILYFCGRQQSG